MDTGQMTKASQERTVEVFGEHLSPLSVVRRILDEVKMRGDDAVVKYSEKIDSLMLEPGQFRIEAQEFEAAWNRVDDNFRRALEAARKNIEAFQRHILGTEAGLFERDGVRLEAVARPLARVGVYIPGGAAAYPSAVLMDVIPAQVAGCREIAVTTPTANLNDSVLAAFHILGLKEVYRIGGPTAVAMLAYGTETVPKVDMIVGAGNIFVTLAKREVCGTVKIDMFAGPSEIFVIADETADPDYVAADLLSQAEHYPGSAIAVSDSPELLAAVQKALSRQLGTLAREEMCRECLEKYGALVAVANLDEAIEVANRVAPEHLEIITKDPRAVARRIENAGTVFLGADTPEAVGDYLAGPSHTLPTGGTARFTSGLSALDFLKRITFVEYSKEALERELPDIETIARSEGLEAHARAARIRIEKE
ncbi:MAG: histidinol dehydrogenase [Planctomycetes bacterium]|nr:histidinol dehydrogenase [Planctomycetota bacterium]